MQATRRRELTHDFLISFRDVLDVEMQATRRRELTPFML